MFVFVFVYFWFVFFLEFWKNLFFWIFSLFFFLNFFIYIIIENLGFIFLYLFLVYISLLFPKSSRKPARAQEAKRKRETESAWGLREKEGFTHGWAMPSTAVIEFFLILTSFGQLWQVVWGTSSLWTVVMPMKDEKEAQHFFNHVEAWKAANDLTTTVMTGGAAEASRGRGTFFLDDDNTAPGLRWLGVFFFLLLLQGLRNRLQGFKILGFQDL